VVGTSPQGITKGPDGNLWFADGFSLARLTPMGDFTKYECSPQPPPGGSFCFGYGTVANITAGADSNLWFTDSQGGDTGRITPSGAITRFPLVHYDWTAGITAAPEGILWFTGFAPPPLATHRD
jgi:virginiamycin B lyase